jgi:hypothetical protein
MAGWPSTFIVMEFAVSNAVIERFEAEKAEQEKFIDTLLAKVEADGRDLVEAEEENLKAAKQRIKRLNAQLEPLIEFEALRSESAGAAARALSGRRDDAGQVRPLGQAGGASFPYASAGAYIVDSMRARGIGPWANSGPDPAALARIQTAAVDHQTTLDTPGLLPKPLIGPVVNTMDAARPFITSIGARPMDSTPGSDFSRRKITQHVQAGIQATEKVQLPSRKMIIQPVDFSKHTYGGTVNISRQDIDWTSPTAWDLLTQDLADVYGLECENAAAGDFATKVLQTEAAADATLAGWATALYNAAVKCYRGGAVPGTHANGRLPDRLWVSLDMWALMGAVVDVARLQMRSGDPSLGSSELSAFSGDVLNVPRIVVPEFDDGTIILGNSMHYEFYEQVIGLLSAVEPAILGVEVAYGGYVAHGMIEANAYCKITAPAAPLTAPAKNGKSSS